MRLCRFVPTNRTNIEPRPAVLESDTLHVLAHPFPAESLTRTGEQVKLQDAQLVAPVMPSKVVAVGLNYRVHAEEMSKPLPETPLIFMKPSTAVIGPEQAIELPSVSKRVDHEAELGVVVGTRCRNLRRDNAMAAVLGYTCVNDVTARDLQNLDVQYTRAKGFDTFCPLGPWIETELNPRGLRIQSRVNGAVRQSATTADMIHSIENLLVFISGVMTLLPGDVIATGTPPGVGPLNAGDVVEIEVEGIGVLRNPVA